ncbi:MAG: metallophosphoesterase family protein [Chthoniobacterales bacterium]
MNIAVIADTHDKLPDSVLTDIATADEIWHLGDVKAPAIIARLRSLGPPVSVVHGNRDNCPDWPAELTYVRAGHTFRLIHEPPKNRSDTNFLLHGHTHVPRDETIDGVRILNPGTVGKPNKGHAPSYAWLTIEESGVDWQLVPIDPTR